MVTTAKPNENRAKNEGNHINKSDGFEKRNYKRDFYDDMEDDYIKKEVKGQKVSGQSKSKRPPDTPPDKYEAMMRLEREKKAKQKKILDEEYSKHKSPMKQKKNSKTNWTKYYENGDFEEDDYF